MVDEWPIIERRIPSMSSVFKRVVDASQIQTKATVGDLDDFLSGIPGSGGTGGGKLALSGDELLVFNAVDGRKSCQQIVESTPLHDFAVCRTLLDLMDRDVVALTDVKGATTRAKSGASVDITGIALMAVAVLLGLFGAYQSLTSPFGLYGLPPLVRPAVNSALVTRLMERLELVDARVRGFRLAQGRLPASLDELVAEGLSTKASLEGIRISATDRGYTVEASGPDGPVRIVRSLSVPVVAAVADPGLVPPAAGAAVQGAAPTPMPKK
jgi:hypothetical protein